MGIPDFSLEGCSKGPVCGLDEVGRGPLAGPVVAACVYIPENIRESDFIGEIRDSKQLKLPKQEELYEQIAATCVFAIAECSPAEIDEINILQASLRAMERALEQTGRDYSHALVDGNHCPKNLPCPATPVIKGDSKSVSIAAASILAKVTRDRLMIALAKEHPYYGWDTNVGYPSRAHLDGIERHGITPHHRKSFGPVRNYIEFGSIERQMRFTA